ncbi:MAG: hypothetical protein V3575_04920 [Candidatus Absconditabacteria bacterium]
MGKDTIGAGYDGDIRFEILIDYSSRHNKNVGAVFAVKMIFYTNIII